MTNIFYSSVRFVFQLICEDNPIMSKYFSKNVQISLYILEESLDRIISIKKSKLTLEENIIKKTFFCQRSQIVSQEKLDPISNI